MPEIISNSETIKDKYYKIIIEALQIAKAAKPGQFVMVKVSDNNEPLLRRPLGVHSVQGSQITILYEVVGKGTKILSQRKSGEYLDIIGPLGNGFDINESTNQRINEPALLVAGGMGVAPLVFLAEKLKNRKPLVLIGAKTKGCILCEKEFKEFNCDVKISTDDGSRGFKGKITELLKSILTNQRTKSEAKRSLPEGDEPTNQRIYACGPKPMLGEISSISKKYNIPAQVSLEEHMACGFGACLGCVVNTTSGYKRVCKEGPIFDAQAIIWRRACLTAGKEIRG